MALFLAVLLRRVVFRLVPVVRVRDAEEVFALRPLAAACSAVFVVLLLLRAMCELSERGAVRGGVISLYISGNKS